MALNRLCLRDAGRDCLGCDLRRIRFQYIIGSSWRGTLMRHFLLSAPITAGAFGMIKAAWATLLIAAPCGSQGMAASGLGAVIRTINLAAVTAVTDENLSAATCTEK
jgi:hypothetical protein